MVASSPGRVKHPVQVVLFDYGGVLRGDGREMWTAGFARSTGSTINRPKRSRWVHVPAGWSIAA